MNDKSIRGLAEEGHFYCQKCGKYCCDSEMNIVPSNFGHILTIKVCKECSDRMQQ